MDAWDTPELSSRKRQIARLLLAGKTRVEVACIAQCAVAVVTRVINELGLQVAEPIAAAPPAQVAAPVEPSRTIIVGWTLGQESQLRQLWDVEGKSASECAAIIGVSRNGIISKARRLKLSRRPSPLRPRDPSAVIPRPPRPPEPAQHAGAQIADLTESTCRYPHGHPHRPDTFFFCAAAVARPGVPYCPEHMAACFGGHNVSAKRERELVEIVTARRPMLTKAQRLARAEHARRIYGSTAA